ALLSHSKGLSDGTAAQRPGIVHRLDKDTSGVIIIAKNNKTHEKLGKAFHDREVEKIYLAVVLGIPRTSKGTINAPIRRSSKDRTRMAIHNQGKSAVTHFEIEEVYQGYSLLKVKIETGRTHQIRVHLASIGHPVIGDNIYGDKEVNEEFEKNFGLKRQFLHANTLSIDGDKYIAPLKKDLLEVLDQLRV
ncbi:MAG: 23S rRNA pseudouridine1911/1915/1917 synthase, partial [Oceanicoccus sp.]